MVPRLDASGLAEYERAVAAGVEAKQIAFGRWLENNAIAITQAFAIAPSPRPFMIKFVILFISKGASSGGCREDTTASCPPTHCGWSIQRDI